MRVVEDGRSIRHLGLAGDGSVERTPVTGKELLDRLQNGRIVGQWPVEQVRHEVARDVVRGRAQSAGHQDEVGPAERFFERGADGWAIGHTDLPVHAQAEREKRLPQECEVRVRDVAEQKLRAGVDDFDSHERELAIVIKVDAAIKIANRDHSAKRPFLFLESCVRQRG